MAAPLKLYSVPTITSVQDMILRSARVYGDKLALEDLKEYPIPRLTFASLLRNILKLGSALRTLGIKERSHIAVLGENRVQWALSYLTGMCFNYVVVPVDRNLMSNEILNILHESDATVVIYSDAFEPLLRESRRSMKRLKHYINMDIPQRKDKTLSMIELIERSPAFSVEKLPKIDPDDEAEIIFTSGSLGRAKGVMLSQRNLAENLMAMTKMIKITAEDRFLGVLPIHHTYACTCGFLCPMFAGSSLHFAQSLKTIVDDLQKVHATILLAVPLLYDKMFKRVYKAIEEKKLSAALVGPLIKAGAVVERFGWKSFRRTVFKEIHERFGGSVRLFIAGGAAQDPMVAKGLREFGFNFVQGYGLTETAPILTLNRLDSFKDDSAGITLPGVTLRISEPDHLGVGEIWSRGPNTMIGYYKNEKATKEVFENGWFKTGDLGMIDEEGFLHISGRKKNVIISKSGENVYPEELEDLVNRSPFILESMVYGEDDPKHDEIIAAQVVVDAEAFIELAETRQREITPDLMKEVIADEIASVNKLVPAFKQIRKFYIRDREFEKTTTQKVKRFLTQKKSK
ncbi:MAG TPA: AMP-binding protein [Bacteroidota bacterium]|nr:AMP-binding protein [Bacteroidota bacterium]